MSYTVTGGALYPERVKLTSTDPTVIYDASEKSALVVSILAVEIAGGTPNLTLEVYDTKTSTSYYIRNAKAMTAKEQVQIDRLDPLKVGEQLRATASVANQVDIHLTYSPRTAMSPAGGNTFIPTGQR